MSFDTRLTPDEEQEWWSRVPFWDLGPPSLTLSPASLDDEPNYDAPIFQNSEEKIDVIQNPPHRLASYFAPQSPFLHPLHNIPSFIQSDSVKKNVATDTPLEHLAKQIAELPTKEARDSFLSEALNQFLSSIPDSASYEVSDKLLCMIHGDKIANHPALTNSVSDNLQFLITILRHADSLTDKKLIDELEALLELQKLIDGVTSEKNGTHILTTVQKAIKELKEGERFLFPGGWKGTPSGHFMIYEITRDGPLFTMTFINTGDGIELYHDLVKMQDKSYHRQAVTVHSIPSTKIASDTVWNPLIDMRLKSYSGLSRIESGDIYEKVIPLLDGKLSRPTNINTDDVLSEQKGGTCGWKALIAYLKHRLAKTESTEQLFWLKFWSLANYLLTHEACTSYTQSVILEKAASGMAALCAKMKLPTSHDMNLALLVYALCNRAHTQAAMWQPKESRVAPEISTPLSKTDLHIEPPPIKTQIENWFNLPSRERYFQISLSEDLFVDHPPYQRGDTPISRWIEKWRTYVTSSSRATTQPYLSHMIALLPLPKPGELATDSVKELSSTLTELVELARLYFNFKDERTHSLFFVNLSHIYILADMIQIALFKKKCDIDITEYGLYFPYAKELFSADSEQSLPIILDLNVQSRLARIGDYLTWRNRNHSQGDDQLFDYPKNEQHQIDFTVSEETIYDIPDLTLFKELFEKKKDNSSASASLHYAIAKEFVKGQSKLVPNFYYKLRELSLLCRHAASCDNPTYVTNYGRFLIEDEEEAPTADSINVRWAEKRIRGDERKGICLKEDPGFCHTPAITTYEQNRARAKIHKTDHANRNQDSTSYFEQDRLADLHQKGESFRPFVLLNYYSDNLHLLEDSKSRDHLQNSLFEFPTFVRSVLKHPTLKDVLQSFFEKAFIRFHTDDTLSRQVQEYLFNLGYNCLSLRTSEEETAASAFPRLKEFLVDKIKIAATRFTATSNILLFCAYMALDIPLSSDDIACILKTIMQREGFGYYGPVYESDRLRALTLFLKNTLDDPVKRALIFSKIEALTPFASKPDALWEGNFPFYKIGNVTYGCLDGLILDRDAPATKTPLTNNLKNLVSFYPFVRQFLKEELQLVENYFVNAQNSFRYYPETKAFHLLIEGVWFCHTLDWKRLSPFQYHTTSPGTNVKDREHWWESIEEGVNKVICTSDTLEKLYVGTYIQENERWIIQDLRTGYYRTENIFGKLPAELQKLANFLDTHKLHGKLHGWVSDLANPRLEELYLPTFDLSLHRSGNSYAIRELFDMTVSTKEFTSPFLTIETPPIVENEEGALFMFIPNSKIIGKKGENSDPLRFNQRISVSVEFKRKYFLYRYNSETQELIPEDLDATFHLAYLYFADHNFNKFFQHLNHCAKPRPYTQEELSHINRFVKYVDKSHKHNSSYIHSACLLHLLLLLIENSVLEKLFTKESATLKADLEPYLKQYRNYIERVNSIPVAYQLTKEQELRIIDFFDIAIVKPIEETIEKKKRSIGDEPPNIDSFKNGHEQIERASFSNRELFLREPAIAVLRSFPKLQLPLPKEIRNASPTIDFQKIYLELPEVIDFEAFLRANRTILGSSRPKIKLTIEAAMSIFMGNLSSDPELEQLAAYYTLFGIFKKTHEKKLDLQLRTLIRMSYKKGARFSIWRILNQKQSSPRQLLTDFEAYRKSSLFEGGLSQLIRAEKYPPKLELPPKRLALPAIEIASNLPLPRANVTFPETPATRNSLFERYFTKITRNATCPNYSLHPRSQAKELIEASPVAKELYDSFFSGKRIPQSTFDFDQTCTDQLLEEIRDLEAQLQHKTKEEKARIAALANASPLEKAGTLTSQEIVQGLQYKIALLATQKQPLTAEHLAKLILRDSWQQGDELHEKVLNWMMLELECQLVSEIHKLLRSKEKESEPKLYLQKLQALMATKRAFSPKEFPRLLAFEYLTKLHLRPGQANRMTEIVTSQNLSELIKLMMGEGKTKVILPGLAILLADGTSFPIILVPQFLYSQNLKDILETSLNLLDQRIYTFTYDRNSDSDLSYFQNLKNLIKKVQKEKACLLTPPDTFQALLLTYQELSIIEEGFKESLDAAQYSAIHDRTLYLRKILALLQKHGIAIIDEAHHNLKSLREVNYTLGCGTSLDPLEWETILSLFSLLIDEGVDFHAPLEINSSDPKDPTVARLRAHLIEKLYPGDINKNIRDYLDGGSEEIVTLIHAESPELAAKLSLIKEELWSFLSYTLSKGLNLFYGKSYSPHIEYAIPYIGNDKPDPVAEFGNPHITINFTIQKVIAEGLTLAQFTKWLTKLKTKWAECAYKQSPVEAEAQFGAFLEGYSLDAITLQDTALVNKLHAQFNKKIDICKNYLKEVVLPSLTFHEKKLNSNAQDLTNLLFYKQIVLSGTPYNKNTYSEAFAKIPSTITPDELLLIEQLTQKQNNSVSVIQSSNAASTLDELKRLAEEDPNLLACVDLGAFFRGIKNQEVAQKLLEKLPQIDAVVFFGDTDELSLLKRGSKTAIPYHPSRMSKEKLFAYFDSYHVTGADIALSPHAKGAVTVSSDTSFDQLLQAFKRLRLLGLGQSICSIISEFTHSHLQKLFLKEEILNDELLLNGIINQVNTLEKEVVAATGHMLKQTAKRSLLAFRDLDTKKNRAYDPSIFVEKISIDPYVHYSHHDTLVAPRNYFQLQSDEIIKELDISHTQKADFRKKHALIIDIASLSLPPRIMSSIGKGMGQEVQKQQEKKALSSIYNSSLFAPFTEASWDFSTLETDTLLPIGALSRSLHDERIPFGPFLLSEACSMMGMRDPLFDPSILVSKNFIKTADLQSLSWDIPIKSVDAFLMRAVFGSTKWKFQAIALSIAEIERFMNYSLTSSYSRTSLNLCLYDIHGKVIAGDAIPADARVEFEQATKRAHVQFSFFDGREYYTKEEEQLLFSWVQSKEDQLHKLYQELHKNRGKNSDFGSGNLFKILKQSKEIRDLRLAQGIRMLS